MTDLLAELRARGFVHDLTPGLDDRLGAGPITGYIGFDPTAASLHVGNLVPVMGLAWLQRSGHTPIALVGGATGMVGDPSGKRKERPILGPDEIDRNAQAIRGQLARFLSFEGANAARLRDNAEWLRSLRLIDFLRDTGKHFTLGYMLQKESVRSRLETGISYTEFSYMVIQAYDFWHLYRTERCELQMGGSDQWGNITAGIELVGRREGHQVHGLVFPLITTASGAKFGKSEAGNIWLDPARTTPYEFYQYWVNTDDRDVGRYLKLFTFLRLDRIEAVLAEHAADPGRRTAQRLLAREVTATVHGEEAAAQAVAAAEAMFGGGGGDRGRAELPERIVSRSELADPMPIIDLLVASGLATSRGDARRGIQGRGFYLDDQPIEAVDLVLTEDDLQGPAHKRYIILRKGKKTYVRLVLTP